MLKLAKSGAALLISLVMAIALFVPAAFAQSTTSHQVTHPTQITWQHQQHHALCGWGGCDDWGWDDCDDCWW